MATFEKRGKYWRAKIKRKLLDGTIYSKSSTRDTKKEAAQWAMMIESQILNGQITSTFGNQISIGSLVDRYQEEITVTKKSVTSLGYRCKRIKRHLGHIMVNDLNSMQVAQYRDMRKQTVGASTINQELQLLKSVLDQADREWGIPLSGGNPVLRVRKYSLPRGRAMAFI